ncbi:MAG: phosphoribosylformylglycinamidine synthase [Thermodesulfovibrionales bacterium]|nr:phosphoribosylformylglycinamidine synthase [Thermodesulfovibrionales bacterium]
MHIYRIPALSAAGKNALLAKLVQKGAGITGMEAEYCFNIGVTEPLTDEELHALLWLLSETFEPENSGKEPFLKDAFEIGPRLNFQTAWSTNAVAVCHAVGLRKIARIECSRRYKPLGGLAVDLIRLPLYDRMTECPYPERLNAFEHGLLPEPVYAVPVMEEGMAALERINRQMGLGLDDWDMDYYLGLFKGAMKRNPTNVECFDLSQSNSEHSRHWFFKGRLVIDGEEIPGTLMDIVQSPYKANPSNSVIAFSDNSSAIRGYEIKTILPEHPGKTSRFVERAVRYHIIFTAETHNFPSGVAPFPGAETGAGGRIRDVQATGRGGLVVAGTAAYSVGNLLIPGYELPWEDKGFAYPANLAPPLEIEIEASNGASDYGNKFGEPVIQGYTRSFGMRLPDGSRREWLKPIMFTGGIGQMDSRHTGKGEPQKGMLVTKIGGPAYRIGMGGGAASSMIQGENIEELDFGAVQRGDAEMEQKLNRVIRACVEMGEGNPIISIHDQGAGGNCNVLKEIVHPAGARIDVRKIPVGDITLSVLEIWGAEYQEQNALLIKPEHAPVFEEICRREKVPCAFVGEITGDGFVVLYDGKDGSTPVNLQLSKVLGEMPQKTFNLKRMPLLVKPLALPEGLTVRDALERVLRLLSVGSKRFLTNKVDRSVTGLIARQQCAGPLQLTVSDVAVIAQSHFGLTGAATAIGEQPIKGLINPGAMARMSVAEALTNIVWAKISRIEDIKCSANWMWAAKLQGEGALLYDAASAMSRIMLSLGIAVDGGKDSLSMAAVLGKTGEVVKSPGTLVISAYAPVPDITKAVTPDIKKPGSGILYMDLGRGRCRLGGSALAQVYGQIGDDCPDMEDPELLKRGFNLTQRLIDEGLILSGHDVSDGGLITALLEMAFSGNCGLDVNVETGADAISSMFAEEAGLLMEYDLRDEEGICGILKSADVPFKTIGKTVYEKTIKISVNNQPVLDTDMPSLREIWEDTGHRLERLQANPECADEEKENIRERTGPKYILSFTPEGPSEGAVAAPPKVAIIREEGSNGDREMASAFHMAGFETWDITMTDLMEERASLSGMSGVAFVGGFSYADVLDSAKGWAGAIRFNKKLRAEFDAFYLRPDTFSLGVCNGCQLMALLGWVPWQGIEDRLQPRFIHNRSGRFESRFSTVRILPSPSVMLRGMEGSVLGVWVAHGEGRAYFPDKKIFGHVIDQGLAPLRYVDDKGEPTEKYPFNPNGSPSGITALCSPDGRHLALMPHPERAFLKWQWAWMPEEWREGLKASPWLRLFQNAYKWCAER